MEFTSQAKCVNETVMGLEVYVLQNVSLTQRLTNTGRRNSERVMELRLCISVFNKLLLLSQVQTSNDEATQPTAHLATGNKN